MTMTIVPPRADILTRAMSMDAVYSLDSILSYLRSTFDGWHINYLENLIAIALSGKDGTTHAHLAKKFNRAVSTNNAIINKMDLRYGLVETLADPTERRRRIIRLTPKGEEVIKVVTKLMQKHHK